MLNLFKKEKPDKMNSIHDIHREIQTFIRAHEYTNHPKQFWNIDKQFDFCYGHRVWTQELDTEFSLDGCLKCRHLHGHQGKIKIGLTSTKLIKGMVTDFKHLNFMKKLIDDWFDHKMIFDLNDPLLFDELKYINFENITDIENPTEYDFFIPRIDKIKKNIEDKKEDLKDTEIQAILEKYEGLVFVNFVPTSENLCKFFFEIADKKMQKFKEEGIQVKYVDYWETPKSHCRYEQ